MYRGLKLWAAAVTEAGSVDPDAVAKALDTASLTEGPGGPAEMVPGQHHLRLNMYIAQARRGLFEVVENLGRVDPKEAVVGQALTYRVVAAFRRAGRRPLALSAAVPDRVL